MKILKLLILLTAFYHSFVISAAESFIFSGMVMAHNDVRAKHQQPPLAWSNSLAQYAQQWVDHLATTQNCTMRHRPNHNGGKYQQKFGENLFWASALELSGGHRKLQNITVAKVVNSWAEEEEFYDYSTNTCQKGEDCGHFTQMVWRESRQIGCALAVCADKSQIWACNYYPRGNYIGEWPY